MFPISVRPLEFLIAAGAPNGTDAHASGAGREIDAPVDLTGDYVAATGVRPERGCFVEGDGAVACAQAAFAEPSLDANRAQHGVDLDMRTHRQCDRDPDGVAAAEPEHGMDRLVHNAYNSS